MAPLSPLSAAVTARIRTVLTEAYPLPVSTREVEERTGYGARYGQLAYRMLQRLAARHEAEKVRLPDARSCYWRMWPQGTGHHQELGGRTMALPRDGHGEPIRELVTRDRGGRFVTPRYRFLWGEQVGPEPSPRESQAAAVLGDIEAG